jgi:hypothetical protein
MNKKHDKNKTTDIFYLIVTANPSSGGMDFPM